MKPYDGIDQQILLLLMEDGRMTHTEIGKRIGLSPPSVLQRIKQMEASGAILGYKVVVSPEKLGFKLNVLTFISLELHQDQPIERFRESVAKIPEVLACFHISGDYDFLLRIIVKDMKGYEQLVREKLSRIRGVAKIQSSFVLGIAKEDSKLPII